MTSLQDQHVFSTQSRLTLHHCCCLVLPVRYFTQNIITEYLKNNLNYMIQMIEDDKVINAADAMLAIGDVCKGPGLVLQAKSLVLKACLLINFQILRCPNEFYGVYQQMLVCLGPQRQQIFHNIISFLHFHVHKIMTLLNMEINDDYLSKALCFVSKNM